MLEFNNLMAFLTIDFFMEVIQGINITNMHCKGALWRHINYVVPELPYVLSLELMSNRIQTIDPRNFKRIPNLEHLSLADNLLDSVPEGISLLKKLQSLDLSRNEELVSDFNKTDLLYKTISQLDLLRYLYLSHITIQNDTTLHQIIGSDNASISAKLESLDVSYCNIPSLDNPKIFQNQPYLKHINLSGNSISYIHPMLFTNLHNLSALYLSHNLISIGPMLKLAAGNVLKILDLSYNKLQVPLDIVDAGSIVAVDLSANNISVWEDANLFLNNDFNASFMNSDSSYDSKLSAHSLKKSEMEMDFKRYDSVVSSTWVNNVNLSHNRITSLSKQMSDSLQVLESVDLGGNPINCNDCRTPTFQEWLRHHARALVLNLGSESNLACTHPINASGKPVVIYDFDSAICDKDVVLEHLNYLFVIGIPVFLLFFIIVAGTGLVYKYRFELTYMLRKRILWRIKKTSTDDTCHKYDAFVCYSKYDRGWVFNKLLPNIEKIPQRYYLCLHEREFSLGSNIWDNIEKSIYSSRHTIVVLSNDFIISQWCRFELDMANYRLFDNEKTRLILIELKRLDRKNIPKRLQFLMDTHTYLEWPQCVDKNHISEADVWKRLKEALGTSIYRSSCEEAPLLT